MQSTLTLQGRTLQGTRVGQDAGQTVHYVTRLDVDWLAAQDALEVTGAWNQGGVALVYVWTHSSLPPREVCVAWGADDNGSTAASGEMALALPLETQAERVPARVCWVLAEGLRNYADRYLLNGEEVARDQANGSAGGRYDVDWLELTPDTRQGLRVSLVEDTDELCWLLCGVELTPDEAR